MIATGYHAHVYFDGSDQHAEALAVREAIASLVPCARLGHVHERPIAFHPTSMFQVAFSPEQFGVLVPWLMLNRGQLTVLVHPLTGDPWQEHTAQALWLGEPLPLDLKRLAQMSA